MISHISIKNFATIEHLDIDFASGLNIITGETGAGKSIIIEAINLALGSRADTAYVRSGTDKALIQLIAEYHGEDIIITREISAAGKSVCRIDDRIVTLGHLREMCHEIADIHGQYDHQSLLNPEYHINLIDTYGKAEITPLLHKVRDIYSQYSSVSSKLHSLLSGFAEKQRKRDFMQFELDEINEADIQDNEDIELQERIELLQNSETIYRNLEQAHCMASDDELSGQILLSGIMNLLQDIAPYSQELSQLSEDVSDIYYRFEDAVSRIRSAGESVVFSPEELNECVARLDLIDRLKSKYGGSLQSISDYADKLSEDLSQIENIDQIRDELTAQKDSLYKELASASEKLTSARQHYAVELTSLIQNELKELNFNNSTLEMKFETHEFTADGADAAEFLISTNKGEPLKPLARIASGGEMSRIMLAFKKITGDYDKIPTMIFDEIDSGISGITASIVGRKLHSIAQGHQILCITHLPQIAACGHHNYIIRKEVEGERTFTKVEPLNDDDKTMEIARLLGGDNITPTTLASAAELIAASSHLRNN